MKAFLYSNHFQFKLELETDECLLVHRSFVPLTTYIHINHWNHLFYVVVTPEFAHAPPQLREKDFAWGEREQERVWRLVDGGTRSYERQKFSPKRHNFGYFRVTKSAILWIKFLPVSSFVPWVTELPLSSLAFSHSFGRFLTLSFGQFL